MNTRKKCKLIKRILFNSPTTINNYWRFITSQKCSVLKIMVHCLIWMIYLAPIIGVYDSLLFLFWYKFPPITKWMKYKLIFFQNWNNLDTVRWAKIKWTSKRHGKYHHKIKVGILEDHNPLCPKSYIIRTPMKNLKKPNFKMKW